jgi:acylphosphatase
MLAKAHIIVSGLVQGVCYRAFTQKKANSYRLAGWVKNLYDGRVEAVCEGEKGLILDFIKELRIGPPESDVTDIKIEWQEYIGEFKDFTIKF